MNDQEFKADGNKSDPTLFDEGFPNAIEFVNATLDYGAIKYEAHSWRKVPNAFKRYAKAAGRHRRARLKAQAVLGSRDGFMRADHESGLPHIAHELFNLMAMIELWIQDNPGIDLDAMLRFNPPPLEHKKALPSADRASRERDATYVEVGSHTPAHSERGWQPK